MNSLSPGNDWASVGDWFSDQGVWFLVSLAVAVLVYLALRYLAPKVVARRLARSAAGRTAKEHEQLVRTSTRVAIAAGTVIILVGLVFALLPRFAVDLAPVGRVVRDWLGSHGVRIAIILVLAFAANRIDKAVIERMVTRGMRRKGRAREEFKKRVETISHFLSQLAGILVWAIAGFMILSELGVNIGPLLASAGVLGIGIGFGAQSLVKDVLAGLFIVVENQYRKGDVVKIADISGVVEEVNLRRTILRDLDGIVHVVPNGQITVASNYTKEYSRVNLNISVAYGEDLDRCIDVINRVGLEMAQEEYWAQAILKPPAALRIDNLGDSGIDIKIVGDTKPIRQWEVMGELRKRIKKRFDEEGIEIPWPHTKVFFGNVLEQGRSAKAEEPTGKTAVGEAGAAQPPAKAPRRRAKREVLPPGDDDEG
jgi:small-conductance mechanosensitive channel